MRNTSFYKRFLFSVLSVIFFFACDSGKTNNAEDSSSSSKGQNSDPGSSQSGGGIGNEIGAHAVLPSNINTGKVQEMYNTWINKYYTTYENDLDKDLFIGTFGELAGTVGTARIMAAYNGSNDGSQTASEAIGYGMIITSLMGDFDKFDKLLAYSKAFRVKNPVSAALMQWDVRDFTSAFGGSATDADIDIVASLFIAYERTKQEKYLNDAIEIGASIYEYEVDAVTKLILPAMKTDALGQKGVYNISYFSLPAIKMLSIYDKSRDWSAVLEASLSHMEMVQNNGNLWPDWNNASGTPTNPDNGSSDCLPSASNCQIRSHEAYYKEGPRIPWRIAWYYHWFGDPRAKAMLDKGMVFLQLKEVNSTADMKTFYSYNGDVQSTQSADVKIWASLCALGMGSNQGFMNGCNEKIIGYYNPALNTYYGSSLQLIYAMLFNGKF